MASFQASSTIEYFPSKLIGLAVFVNTIDSMNWFGTSNVAIRCWGTLWSPLAFGWGTFWCAPALGSGSACTTSDSHDMMMADLWQLRNGGTMAPTGCCRFGSGVRAMTVLARFRLVGSGTCVVRIVLSQHAWSGCRTSRQMSKSSSSISDHNVDSPGSSLSSLLISLLVSSSSCFIRRIAWTIATSATTVVSVRNTRVFRMALTALTEPRTLWRRITRYPSRCLASAKCILGNGLRGCGV